MGDRQQRLICRGSEIWYHQTAWKSADKILNSGQMLRGSSGYAGGGIYFAQRPEDTNGKAESTGVYIRCLVFPGRTHNIYEPHPHLDFSTLAEKGYDSVMIHGLQTGIELVVYNMDQVVVIDGMSTEVYERIKRQAWTPTIYMTPSGPMPVAPPGPPVVMTPRGPMPIVPRGPPVVMTPCGPMPVAPPGPPVVLTPHGPMPVAPGGPPMPMMGCPPPWDHYC